MPIYIYSSQTSRAAYCLLFFVFFLSNKGSVCTANSAVKCFSVMHRPQQALWRSMPGSSTVIPLQSHRWEQLSLLRCKWSPWKTLRITQLQLHSVRTKAHREELCMIPVSPWHAYLAKSDKVSLCNFTNMFLCKCEALLLWHPHFNCHNYAVLRFAHVLLVGCC